MEKIEHIKQTEKITGELTIKQIYDLMVKYNLSYKEMAAFLDEALTAQGLHYHIKRYCEKNKLPHPSTKRGAKAKEKLFGLK